MQTFIDSYVAELKRCLDSLDKQAIEHASEMLLTAYTQKRNIFLMGNGGSAATASHMACDLGKGTLRRVYDQTEARFRVYSLTDNVALMTAFANDVSFDEVFVQQLRNLVEKDDVVIVMSGSGNSKNLVKAVAYAKKCGAKTIGFLGFHGSGKLTQMVDCAIIATSDHYGPSEDIQLILDHLLVSWIAKVKHKHDGVTRPRKKNKSVPFE